MPRKKSMLVATFEQKQQLVIAKAGVKLAEYKLKQLDLQQKTLEQARSTAQKELEQAKSMESKLSGQGVGITADKAAETTTPKKRGGRPKGSKNKPKEAPTPPVVQDSPETAPVESIAPIQAPLANETPERAAVRKLLEEFNVPPPKSAVAASS